MMTNLDYIQSLVESNARVLDLGCGDGSLLLALQQSHHIEGLGIDIDLHNITNCLDKGLSVVQQDLNLGLTNFQNQSFDLVLMTHALQETKNPAQMLREMVRIGKQAIVSIPNMGYWKCRWQIAVRGRMPVSTELPYSWHDSSNIHLCTLKDFEQLCRDTEIQICERFLPHTVLFRSLINRVHSLANLFAGSAFYRLGG